MFGCRAVPDLRNAKPGTPMRLASLSLFVLLLAPAARADEWQPVATELLAKEKTGFGGLSGVAVDRATGALYICLSDRGLFRSTDQGKSWERYGKGGKDVLKGRTETPGCFQLDPTGKTKRFVLARVYGGPVILGATDSDSWRSVEKKCQHVDWYAP